MSLLTDVLVAMVASVVDLVSHIVFQFTAILLLSLIWLLKILILLFHRLVKLLIQTVEVLVDAFLSALAKLASQVFLSLVYLLIRTSTLLVEFLFRILDDLVTDVQTGAQKLGSLLVEFADTLGKVVAVSLSRIWNNLLQAVADFIHRLLNGNSESDFPPNRIDSPSQ